MIGRGCGATASSANDRTVANAWHRRSLALEAKAFPYRLAIDFFAVESFPSLKISSLGHSCTAALADTAAGCGAALARAFAAFFLTVFPAMGIDLLISRPACRPFKSTVRILLLLMNPPWTGTMSPASTFPDIAVGSV